MHVPNIHEKQNYCLCTCVEFFTVSPEGCKTINFIRFIWEMEVLWYTHFSCTTHNRSDRNINGPRIIVAYASDMRPCIKIVIYNFVPSKVKRFDPVHPLRFIKKMRMFCWISLQFPLNYQGSNSARKKIFNFEKKIILNSFCLRLPEDRFHRTGFCTHSTR